MVWTRTEVNGISISFRRAPRCGSIEHTLLLARACRYAIQLVPQTPLVHTDESTRDQGMICGRAVERVGGGLRLYCLLRSGAWSAESSLDLCRAEVQPNDRHSCIIRSRTALATNRQYRTYGCSTASHYWLRRGYMYPLVADVSSLWSCVEMISGKGRYAMQRSFVQFGEPRSGSTKQSVQERPTHEHRQTNTAKRQHTALPSLTHQLQLGAPLGEDVLPRQGPKLPHEAGQ